MTNFYYCVVHESSLDLLGFYVLALPCSLWSKIFVFALFNSAISSDCGSTAENVSILSTVKWFSHAAAFCGVAERSAEKSEGRKRMKTFSKVSIDLVGSLHNVFIYMW